MTPLKRLLVGLVVFVIVLFACFAYRIGVTDLEITRLKQDIEAYKNDVVLLEQARDSWKAKAEATPKIDTNYEFLKQILQNTKTAELNIRMDSVNGTTGNLTISFANP